MASPEYLRKIESTFAILGIAPALIAARALEICEEASELVSIGPDFLGREQRLAPAAAAAWLRMQAAAARAGIELIPVSAFRSFARQTEILQGKLDAGQDCAQILRVSAPPGYSEHHTGHALDIGTPDSETLADSFGNTPAFEWLQAHAADFGFHLSYPRNNPQGFAYEPWHWRHRPDARLNSPGTAAG